jgi:hypothetical protein
MCSNSRTVVATEITSSSTVVLRRVIDDETSDGSKRRGVQPASLRSRMAKLRLTLPTREHHAEDPTTTDPRQRRWYQGRRARLLALRARCTSATISVIGIGLSSGTRSANSVRCGAFTFLRINASPWSNTATSRSGPSQRAADSGSLIVPFTTLASSIVHPGAIITQA